MAAEDTNDEQTKRRRARRRHRPARSKALPEIFFCGDPHGSFDHINAAAREYKPDAMVILGDLQPSAPLDEVLAEALEYTQIWWIPGNHDTDSDAIYDHLWRGGLANRNLHGRVANVCGLRIAGLGGVFRGQVWMPDDKPNYDSPTSFVRRSGGVNLWRGGLPRRHRTTIFPSVYENLKKLKADILVTHEAPSCHRKGFEALDRLAKALNVRWFFHGHQHEDRAYGRHQGVLVRGVGYRGIVNLKGDVIVPAQMDPREALALQSAIEWAGREEIQSGGDEGVKHVLGRAPETSTAAHEAALGREVAKLAPGGRYKPAKAPDFDQGGAGERPKSHKRDPWRRPRKSAQNSRFGERRDRAADADGRGVKAGAKDGESAGRHQDAGAKTRRGRTHSNKASKKGGNLKSAGQPAMLMKKPSKALKKVQGGPESTKADEAAERRREKTVKSKRGAE